MQKTIKIPLNELQTPISCQNWVELLNKIIEKTKKKPNK